MTLSQNATRLNRPRSGDLIEAHHADEVNSVFVEDLRKFCRDVVETRGLDISAGILERRLLTFR